MAHYNDHAFDGATGKVGSLRLGSTYDLQRKSIWLVLLKLLGAAGVLAVGLAIMLPSVPLPTWQAAVLTAGLMLIYVGLAFFLRPEPNTDNMGLMGGLVNDPFTYSDNLNRHLYTLHMILGPGRFVAGTIVDLCTLAGLASSVENKESEKQSDEERLRELRERYTTSRRKGTSWGGAVPLDSTRFLEPASDGSSSDASTT